MKSQAVDDLVDRLALRAKRDPDETQILGGDGRHGARNRRIELHGRTLASGRFGRTHGNPLESDLALAEPRL
jgi:hypothetical protein